MSFIPNFPPSLLSKVSEEATGEQTKGRRSKDDYRQMKALEEARKSAAVPAMKDEFGNDINPHIPQYIMQAPWYIGSLVPTLKHQRLQEPEKEATQKLIGFNKWYRRGNETRVMNNAKEFRPGACENCGAMGHKKRDCLERPRKVGAKFTNEVISTDDIIQQEIEMDFDTKRDLWNGYDPAQHHQLILKFQRLEEEKKAARAKQIEEKLMSEQVTAADLPIDDVEEDKYGDELDMPGQKFDSKQRQSIRNLRIREDTAKYLYNLNPNSAYYDPKTRSMRENPFADSGKSACEVPYAGDNFVRYQGDVLPMMQGQMFAWEMHDQRGLDVHLQADPTRLELLTKKVHDAKQTIQQGVKKEVLERYGGEEHLDAPPRELLVQSEAFEEYSRTGHLLKGQEKPKVLSRYEEDVYLYNHKSVWGSFWNAGKWGYACCHSLIKESYCTGTKNKTFQEFTTPFHETSGDANTPVDGSADDAHNSSEVAQSQEKGTKRKKDKKKKSKKTKHSHAKKAKRKRRDSSSSSSSSASSSDSDS